MYLIKIAFYISLLSSLISAQRCGPGFGNAPSGLCCSQWGWAGRANEYCNSGCQTVYGVCNSPAPTPPLNTNGKCGPEFGSCPEGLCCSQFGYCGSGFLYCSKCKAGYGSGCQSVIPPTLSPTPVPSSTGTNDPINPLPLPPGPTPTVSPDWRCGVIWGAGKVSVNAMWICPHKGCCNNGICGSSPASCGVGCDSRFGVCDSLSSAVPIPESSSTAPHDSTPPDNTPSPPQNNELPSTATIYRKCVNPKHMAITFDDGPFIYTEELLNILQAAGAKATFFVNGNNYACIYSYASVLKRAYSSGHQIGSHTWSHLNLATASRSRIVSELKELEAALQNIIGVTPTYFRPPYGAYNPMVLDELTDLGYSRVIMWDVDVEDYLGDAVKSIHHYKDYIDSNPAANAITVQHDTASTTVFSIVPWILNHAKENGIKLVTVGECLGDNPEKWYRNKQDPPTPNPTWGCKRLFGYGENDEEIMDDDDTYIFESSTGDGESGVDVSSSTVVLAVFVSYGMTFFVALVLVSISF